MQDITKTLSELSAIRQRISNNTASWKLAKHLKKSAIPLNIEADNDSLLLNSRPGIYYFEAKFNFLSIAELNDFGRSWGTIRGDNGPEGISRYYPNRAKHHVKRLAHNRFIPFYLGKREDISKRIINHLDGEEKSRTYSLKLRSRPELLRAIQLKYSYCVFDISPECYFGVEILERSVRELLNPIIGKQ